MLNWFVPEAVEIIADYFEEISEDIAEDMSDHEADYKDSS